MGKKHVLKVRGLYNNIRQICDFVTEGAQMSGLDEGALFHIELACDEACTNIIEHAYEGEDAGDIEVSWWRSGTEFIVTFHDNGRAFDPTDVPPPAIGDLSTTSDPENLRVGGLGIHFMRTLMDDIRYSFDPQKGNTLTMIKQIGGK
ncbi:MAG: ATP-binding protein [Anaerolineales bacterium]|nr:ATP-binding protein [Anaerolineales bacterium]